MEEKFKIVFDRSAGILYKYYYGAITYDNIFSSWDYAIANNLIPKETKGFILDYREATFEVILKEYWRISDYYRNHLEIFGNKKIAVITQTSKDVLIPSLLESEDESYLSKPFYTYEAALRWIFKES
jgi:hypothetical protein